MMIHRKLLTTVLALSPSLVLAGEPISLFNGKDLSGWTAVLADENTKVEDVWTVQDGVLMCKGQPVGYIRTDKDFSNYELSLQWRFPEGSQGGNSGVLVHTSEPGAIGIWPKSIEVQLHRGDAGDFWVIGTDLNVENEDERKMGRRHLNLTDNSENPIGEWNTMVIRCKGDSITVTVNGDLVNEATNCSATEGAISLQSEGAPIEFREIVLTPIDD
ncbi:3-keto-disaccharide hydrolase [Tautonia rosea]|uniref:3-keto-disaccharide hydrolase n=1 Tax=Tautonia rosea TaxID=2728037 RepID=UPI0019D2299D|nr:DUF1080 domain-containing protein [Tautonia rosea]